MRKLDNHARSLLPRIPEEMKPVTGWDDFIFWGNELRLINSIGNTDEQDLCEPLQIVFPLRKQKFCDFSQVDTARAVTLKRFLKEVQLARSGEQGIFKKDSKTEPEKIILVKGVSSFWFASIFWHGHSRLQIWEMWAGNPNNIYFDGEACDIYGL